MAVVRRLNPDVLKVWRLLTASTPDADSEISANILAGVHETIFQNVNDGLLVQHTKKFNVVCFSIPTDETGAPVYTFSYYNGSAYAAVTNIKAVAAFIKPAGTYLVFAFGAPLNWAKGTTAGVGGTDGMYSLKITATTAPATAPQIDGLVLGELIAFREAVADNGYLEVTCHDRPLVLDAKESLMPFFATANANNMVEVLYSTGRIG